MSRTPDGRDASDYRGLALAGTAVMELVAPIFLGVWVDQQFGWSPWGLVVGGTIGFVGSITHMMMLANRENKRKSG